MSYEPSAAEVKELRGITGAGIMECKAVLKETEGKIDAALKLLRERGITKSAKRADRETTEGVLASYIHGNRVGVLVEVGCETDFVAGTDEFKAFAQEIALQIAALPDTRYVSRDEVPAELVAAELEIYVAQAADRPEQVREKIAQGKLAKWYEGVVLLDQASVRDGDQTIEQMRAALSAKTGENVQIKRFARFERGA